ncbi:MAG: hypothetical protein AAFX06_15570 [Planctomycetota bacterium]
MVSDAIARFLEHPKRTLIVWCGALLLGLLFVPAAWDELTSARKELSQSDEELANIVRTVELAEAYRARMTSSGSEASMGGQLIDADAAESMRLKVTRLAKQARCGIRRLALSDVLKRPWDLEGDPFRGAGLTGDSRFVLETRNLTLTVDGTLPQLAALHVALEELGPFVVPSEMRLRNSGVNGQLSMELDLSLFDLTEKFD